MSGGWERTFPLSLSAHGPADDAPVILDGMRVQFDETVALTPLDAGPPPRTLGPPRARPAEPGQRRPYRRYEP